MRMDIYYVLLFAGSGALLGLFLSGSIILVNVMDAGKEQLAGWFKKTGLAAAGGVILGLAVFFLLVYADLIL